MPYELLYVCLRCEATLQRPRPGTTEAGELGPRLDLGTAEAGSSWVLPARDRISKGSQVPAIKSQGALIRTNTRVYSIYYIKESRL